MSFQLAAQKITYNSHGERIVIYPNEKWEYYDISNPLHRTVLKKYEDGLTEKGGATSGFDTPEKVHQQLVQLAEEDLAMAEERESDLKFSIILLEEEIERLESNKIKGEELLKVKKQLKLAATLNRKARKNTKRAKKKLKRIKKNKNKTIRSQNKIKSKTSKVKTTNNLQSSMAFQEDASFYTASKRFKKYTVEEDVMYHPPRTKCKIIFDGIDDFSGKKRKDVSRSVLFTHTDEAMQRYMEGEDYIVCEGNLTEMKGGVLFLNLFISISTTDAKRSFGGMAKASLLTVKMIDGTKVNLANNQSDEGTYDALTKRHTYTAQFRINSGQEKKLKRGEVDKVRIIWGTGYENYEVYYLDFFIDQFRCLNK